MSLIRADSRQIPLRDGCVQTVVTSPPYFGLRDYGVSGQIGLESTPDAYVAQLVDVFREVRRVLKDDGTVWLNLGDSYANDAKWGGSSGGKHVAALHGNTGIGRGRQTTGLKGKDLIGIPWRVAFALQADGWYLRSDIIWSKPNPMPESVTDRPTKAHEYLFLLTKSDRYSYDAAAISERVSEASVVAGADGQRERLVFVQHFGTQDAGASDTAVGVRLASAVFDIAERQNDLGLLALDPEIRQQRPDRSTRLPVVHVPVVRDAATQAARFTDGDISAKEFLEQMHGLCVALPDGDDLKEAWRLAVLNVGHVHADGDRPVAVNDAGEVSKIEIVHDGSNYSARVPSSGVYRKSDASNNGRNVQALNSEAERRHQVGSFNNNPRLRPNVTRNKRSVWTVPTMPYAGAHFATMPEQLVEPCIMAGCPLGGLVFDPFIGSGTVGAVAERLGRRWVGTDLNPAYHQLARTRTAQRGLSWGAP